MNFGTCIVVDSGALCTSVAVISGRKVVKWKNIPVGGWHVSENLKEGMQWHPEDSIEVCIVVIIIIIIIITIIHSEELHVLYRSPNIVRMIKSIRLR